MVERFLSLINRRVAGLHEAAYLLGIFALLSQILALVRDRLLAHLFGASASLDLYYAAFRIPDLIFAAVASVVSVYVLIPFFTERFARSIEDARRFLDSLTGAFLLVMGVVSVAVWILVPLLVESFLPAFVARGQGDTLVLLTRLLLLQPILLGLSSLIGTVTQSMERFMLYAISPLLYNLGIILGVAVLYPLIGLEGIVWGVIVGAVLHLAVQVPFITKIGFLPNPFRRIVWGDVWEVVHLSLPRTIALAAGQIVLFILVATAASLSTGSVAIFSFAYNLQAVPLAIIGVSYSVAAFPTLARLFSAGDRAKFFEYVATACRHIIFWSLPATALVIVLRAQIVRTVLGTGAFDWTDTRLTAAAFALLIVSLLAQSLTLLIVRGYYAAGETRRPLIMTLTGAAFSVVSALFLLHAFRSYEPFRGVIEDLLRVSGLPGTEVLMLPLGYAIGQIVTALLLVEFFERDFSRFPRFLARTTLVSFGAAVVIGLTSYLFLNIFDDLFDINTFIGIVLQGFLSGGLGIAAGISFLSFVRSEELAEAARSLRRRFWETPVVAEELEP